MLYFWYCNKQWLEHADCSDTRLKPRYFVSFLCKFSLWENNSNISVYQIVLKTNNQNFTQACLVKGATVLYSILDQIPSNPCFICRYPWFLLHILSPIYHRSLSLFIDLEHVRVAQIKWEGRCYMGDGKPFMDVRAKLFWRTISCYNRRPDAGSQSDHRSRRGMGSQSPRIMHEYELATVIKIWTLIQTHMCEMGSTMFVAMSRLKFADKTRASFPSMPST